MQPGPGMVGEEGDLMVSQGLEQGLFPWEAGSDGIHD